MEKNLLSLFKHYPIITVLCVNHPVHIQQRPGLDSREEYFPNQGTYRRDSLRAAPFCLRNGKTLQRNNLPLLPERLLLFTVSERETKNGNPVNISNFCCRPPKPVRIYRCSGKQPGRKTRSKMLTEQGG